MTETLSKARADIGKAIESRVVEIMAAAVRRSAAAIAVAVLNECDRPLDAGSLNDAIADQLGSWDFSGEVNLATGDVPAG